MRSTSISHQEFKNGFVNLTLIHTFVMVNSLNEIFKGLNKTLGFAVGLRIIRSSFDEKNSTICHEFFKLIRRKLGSVVRN